MGTLTQEQVDRLRMPDRHVAGEPRHVDVLWDAAAPHHCSASFDGLQARELTFMPRRRLHTKVRWRQFSEGVTPGL